MIIGKEKTIRINGNDYWTITQFAKLTDRTENCIRILICKGNSIRKLRVEYFAGNKPFIPVREIFDFPFTFSGRASKNGKSIIKFVLKPDGNLLKERVLYI